ncbi:MAG: hypothetical protein JXQ87_02535 [Bacteroidia bacterium]
MTKRTFKTTIDYTVTTTIIILALIILIPFFLTSGFRESSVGLYWMCLCLIIAFAGLLKLAQYKVDDDGFSKRDLLLLRKRTFYYSEIEKVKVGQKRKSNFTQFDLFGFLGFKRRYSNFRILKVQFRTGSSVRIDERVMAKEEFDKMLRRLKGRSKNHRETLNRN